MWTCVDKPKHKENKYNLLTSFKNEAKNTFRQAIIKDYCQT